MSTCEFCQKEVFNDHRHVGSVWQTPQKLVHYHLACLYAAYPNEKDYQKLVIKLFKKTP